MKELINNIFYKNKKRSRSFSKSTKKRSKVSIVTQFFPPDYAATGQLIDDLTKRISLSYPINFEINTGMPAYAFKKGEKVKKDILEDFRIIRRSSISKLLGRSIFGRSINGLLFSLRVSLRLLFDIANRRDLFVYTTEPLFLPFFAWINFKLTGIPYILIVYDLYPDILINFGIIKKDNFLIKIWKYLNIKSFSKASEIIVLSESMKRKILNYSNGRDDNISVIPSWSDPKKIYPIGKKNNPFVTNYGLSNTFNVLYSGNQGRCHDLLTIVGAALILKNNKKIKFIIIGDGHQNLRIKEIASELNLKNCIFLPFQKEKDLIYSLNSANLALITLNTFSEGLVAPSKLYGHLAAETPIGVISPINSYLKELVEKYDFGRWFSNGDSHGLSAFIEELQSNVELSEKLGLNGKKYLIDQVNPNIIMDKYYGLIKKNLNN